MEVLIRLGHFRHDRRDVSGHAIDGGKAGVGLSEDEVEVGPRQYDRFDTLALLERVCKLPQLVNFGGRNLSLGRQR